MVQLDEECRSGSQAASEGFETIAAIGRERIRRAGAALRECGFTGDTGFRALRLDSSTRAEVWMTADETRQESLLGLQATVKSDRTDEDLLFSSLLDLGIDPASPVAQQTIDGHVIFDVADGAVLACFSEYVSKEALMSIGRTKPLHVLFRDAAFKTDAARINAEQMLKQLSPNTTIATV